MYNIIMQVLIGILSLSLFVSLFKLRKARKEIKELLIASLPIPKKDDDIIREDFLKFISDSREWAFNYIEQFQSELNKFTKDVDSTIEYFDKYGNLGAETPDKEALRKISLAYKELIKLLPEEKLS